MSEINISVLLDEATLVRFFKDIEKRRTNDNKEVFNKRKIEYVEAVRAIDYILTLPKKYEDEQKVLTTNAE